MKITSWVTFNDRKKASLRMQTRAQTNENNNTRRVTIRRPIDSGSRVEAKGDLYTVAPVSGSRLNKKERRRFREPRISTGTSGRMKPVARRGG